MEHKIDTNFESENYYLIVEKKNCNLCMECQNIMQGFIERFDGKIPISKTRFNIDEVKQAAIDIKFSCPQKCVDIIHVI